MRIKEKTISPDFDESFEENPERNLLAAVIAGAITDLHSKNVLDRREAVEFFLTPDSRNTGLLTFEYCCEELDLNPNDILQAIKDNPSIRRVTCHRVVNLKKGWE